MNAWMPDMTAQRCANLPVAGGVAVAVTFPERSTMILLEITGLIMSALMAEQQPNVVVPATVSPVPVTRMPPSPVALCSAHIPRPFCAKYRP